jgi:hypothetical protein
MSNIDRQTFVSEIESKENKPKTTREFHIVLMDYFIGNMRYQSDVSGSTQKIEENFKAKIS